MNKGAGESDGQGGEEASSSDWDRGYVCDHTDGCGYEEPGEGAPCTHKCVICCPEELEDSDKPDDLEIPVFSSTDSVGAAEVTAMIAGLPTVDSIYENAPGDADPEFPAWKEKLQETVENIRTVKAAYDALPDEEQEQISGEYVAKLLELVNFVEILGARMQRTGTGTWVDLADTSWYDSDTSAVKYEISTAEELAGLAKLVNGRTDFNDKTIVLTEDIDLEGHDWIPIGGTGGSFWGTFDGDDHTILNMNITIEDGTSADRYAGLFGNVYGGTVRNVTVDEGSSLSINYASNTGPVCFSAIAGNISNGGALENCHSFAQIEVACDNDQLDVYVGGAAGRLQTGIVKNCSNAGDIRGISLIAGGVVGGSSSNGTVRNCWNNGNITVDGTYAYVGGIIGKNGSSLSPSGKIENCYNTGNIEGKKDRSYYGGMAGENSGTIKNCYSTGILTVPNSNQMYAGGVLGSNEGTIANSYWLKDSGINERLEAVGRSNQESNVLSFGEDGVFTAIGSVTIEGSAYTSLLPALNAWVEIQSGDYWYWSGDMTSPELSEDPPPSTYTVTVTVKKDDVVWRDHGKTFQFNNGSATVTNLNSVTDGTYDVYEGTTDTGVDVTVDGASAGVTVDYYTVTFYDGDIPYGAASSQAPQFVPKGQKVSAPLKNPVKENYIFDKWVTSANGSEEFAFGSTKITQSTSVYASWTTDTSTEVNVVLSVGREGPYFKDDELTLKVIVTNQNTLAEVKTGKVQFYKGTQALGEAVSYHDSGMGTKGFVLSVVCGSSIFMPELGAGADNSITAVYIPTSGTAAAADPVKITVLDKKDGRRYIGTLTATVEYDGSDKGVCPVQFTVANQGGGAGITARAFRISAEKENQKFTDFTVEYNNTDTIAYVYTRQPGSYEFTVTLDDSEYAGTKTVSAAVKEQTTYTISGMIKGNDIGRGIPATLQLRDKDNVNLRGEVAAAADGTYTIFHVPAGTYSIVVSYSGYDSGVISDISVTNSNITGKDLTLMRSVYMVTFDANGGRVTPGAAATDSTGRISALPVPTRSGSYRFDGWYTAADGGIQVTEDRVYTQDSTIYAHWVYTGSSGSGSGSSSSTGSQAVAQPTTASTTTIENGVSVTTIRTTAADSSGKKTVVTTQVIKDVSGSVTQSTTTVTTENISVSTEQGQAVVAVRPDAAAINRGAAEAAASAASPLPVSVLMPQEQLVNELCRTDVNSLRVDVILSKSVLENEAVQTIGVVIPKEAVEAARQNGKSLEAAVREETGNVESVWSLSGRDLAGAFGEATDLILYVHTAPVQSEDWVAAFVKPPVAARGHDNGLAMSIAVSGTLLTPAKLTVPAINHTGITAGTAVTLYNYDQRTGALKEVSGSPYTVDINGNVTIDIPAGVRTGTAEFYVILASQGQIETVEEGLFAPADNHLPDSTGIHKIVKGDTLNSLSRRYGCSVEELLALNPGVEIFDLQVGSDMVIPVR